MPGTRPTIVLLVALMLLGATLVPTTGLAQDDEPDDDEADDEADDENEDRDDPEDQAEREEDRRIEIQTEANNVEISLEREVGEAEDEVEMTWDADEATFTLEHESENETQETENELKVVLGALAEYEDRNNNSRYDPGEALASGWTLGDEYDGDQDLEGEAEWRPATIEDITHDGDQGKLITSTASLGEEGTLTLRFLVFGEFVNLNGTDLSPTSAKIDIIIENYPFQENGTDLALFLETETENEIEQEIEDDDETGIQATNAADELDSSLVFTWLNHADVDGETQPVETTLLEEEVETEIEEGESSTEHERSFVLSYPRGEEIVHDPKAEVLLASNATTDVPTIGLPAVLAVLATVSGLLTRKTRNG